MRRLVVILMLFVFIGAGDLLITYKSSSSVFGYMERHKDDDETSKVQDYERPERDPKLADTLSDFTNKIDCEEYFANKKGMYYPQTNEYLVSHNVFVNGDRSKVTVDITSRYYKKDGIYSGEMRCHIQNCKYLIWAHLPKQLYFDTKSITVVLLKVTLFLIFFLGITLSQQAN